ncbi:MAG: zinc ribbon domain-containing protein [Coriobacteriia bacterium]|nr:zinc ribbon domain-containing protein [Coriobacteriia bacterium]
MKICPKCQNPQSDTSKFCTICAYKFEDEQGDLGETWVLGDELSSQESYPDPFSEDNVAPVALPNEEYTLYSSNLEQTRVAPIRASSKPGYVTNSTYQPAPQRKTNWILNIFLIILSIFLIVAIFYVLFLIFSTSNPVERIAQDPNANPTIISVPKQEEQEESQTLAPVQSGIESEAPEEKKDENAEADESSLAGLNEVYQRISRDSGKITDLIHVFDESYEKSVIERSNYINEVRDKIKELEEYKKQVQAYEVSDKYQANRDELAHLIDLNISRLEVLEDAYAISLTFGDNAMDKKQEILQPFRNAYREGTSRSKYLLELEERYPNANPENV